MASSATDSANRDRDIREQLVSTGAVDALISVGNNFFYTLSLPCTLWFFDRNKREEIKDKVLFIDARNYFTVVDRTLNEWTEWQLKNLQSIVHLYRGNKEAYFNLLSDYRQSIQDAVAELPALGSDFGEAIDEDTRKHFRALLPKFTDNPTLLREHLARMIEQTKDCIKSAETTIKKREVKGMRLLGEAFCNELQAIITVIDERQWLVDKFGEEGVYQDIAGLCKIASREEIAEKNYSLTPGAYVGVAEVADDGVDFHERMNEIHEELKQLNAEANTLFEEINKAWEEMA